MIQVPGQDPAGLAVAAVRSLAPYVIGKPVNELERELGITDVLKLASNENPLGPSPAALAAMRAALADARAAGRKVVPACSYVAKFIERHREYQDLLAG